MRNTLGKDKATGIKEVDVRKEKVALEKAKNMKGNGRSWYAVSIRRSTFLGDSYWYTMSYLNDSNFRPNQCTHLLSYC